MAEALALEKTDEHGHPVKRLLARSSGNPRKATKQRANMAEMAASSDDEDHDYEEPKSASSPSSDSGDDMLPSNAEVAAWIHKDVKYYVPYTRIKPFPAVSTPVPYRQGIVFCFTVTGYGRFRTVSDPSTYGRKPYTVRRAALLSAPGIRMEWKIFLLAIPES